MKRLALPLLLVAAPAGVAAAADQLAPPVRQPAPATSAPAAQPTSPAPRTASCGAGAAPCARPAPASEDSYFAALSASPASSGGDPLLDKGLMKAMSRLIAANRCNDAVALATQNNRAELAGRAKQLCKAN